MLLSPQAHDFAKLILKHYGKTIEHTHPKKEAESHHIPKVETDPLPKTNKEKYSLDYSKWYKPRI